MEKFKSVLDIQRLATGKSMKGGTTSACVVEGHSPTVCRHWVQIDGGPPLFVCEACYKKLSQWAMKEKKDSAKTDG